MLGCHRSIGARHFSCDLLCEEIDGLLSSGDGGFEIRYTKAVRFRLIKETKPLGMALVLSKANMRSVDPILPLKI